MVDEEITNPERTYMPDLDSICVIYWKQYGKTGSCYDYPQKCDFCIKNPN